MHQIIHIALRYITIGCFFSFIILGIINLFAICFIAFFGEIYFKKVHKIELKFDTMTYFSSVGYQEVIRRIVKYVLLYYKIEYSKKKNKLESWRKKLDHWDNPFKGSNYDIKKEKKWFIYICITFKLTMIYFFIFLILTMFFMSIHY